MERRKIVEQFDEYFDLEMVSDFGLTKKECIDFAEYLFYLKDVDDTKEILNKISSDNK